MSDAVNTRTVRGRRKLRFHDLHELVAEAGRIADADRAGTLTRLGNWSTGQVFDHLACWMDYPYDGFPIKPGFALRILGRLIKPLMLWRGMPAGGRLPGIPGGTYAVAAVPLEQGLTHLQNAVQRLQTTDPSRPNPVFGPMSHEQWIALNLRHAELHLGFLVPPAK